MSTSTSSKITIIGLGLVGNSIGLGLKQAGVSGGASIRVVGFDPDRAREEAALRRHLSVDEIAPDLESAVRGAELVILATPASAVREVLAAIGPMLDDGAVVTDTLSAKEQVMHWAGELLDARVSFVGGHPFSKSADLEAPGGGATPSADLFRGAHYCIMPLPSARNEALSRVIWLAETLGARPLFIDPREHDSFMAAVSHLPTLTSAAMLRITTQGPLWGDMAGLASGQFGSVTEPLLADPETLRDAILGNRQPLIHWIDQYVISLYALRDMVIDDDRQALLDTLQRIHEARKGWDATGEVERAEESRLRAELNQAIEEARPGRQLMGSYLVERFLGKRDKERRG